MRTNLIAALVAAMLMFPVATLAATITFTGPYGSPVAPTAEGAFTYSTFSGGLFRDSEGNGDLFDMEGCSACGGGVLDIVRNDVAGGLFTFVGADIAFQFASAHDITFAGFRLGNLVGTEVFTTPDNSSFATVTSVQLAGAFVDELRVTLDAASEFATVVDNVRVMPQAVPEPASLALIGSGLLIAARRMRTRR